MGAFASCWCVQPQRFFRFCFAILALAGCGSDGDDGGPTADASVASDAGSDGPIADAQPLDGLNPEGALPDGSLSDVVQVDVASDGAIEDAQGESGLPVGSLGAWNAAATYKGMNLGQSLEAWVFDADQVITKSLIDTLVSSGIRTLRLPVKSHINGTATTADATLSDQVKSRVLEVLSWCEAANPRPQVLFDPLHHYHHYIGDPNYLHPDEELVNPADTDVRAVNIWKQWAQLTQNHGDWLAFDLVNEPFAWDATRTNEKYAELLAAIRPYTNRPVFVEPGGQASPLRVWDIEGDYLQDMNVGISVHLYGPGSYTHGSTGSAYAAHMRAVIAAEHDMVLWWAQEHGNRAINIGEFGSKSSIGNTGRDLFQAAHRAEAEARIAAGANISGHAWMFGSDFALLDNNGGNWTWKPGMQAAVAGDLSSIPLDPIPADLLDPKTATVVHVQDTAASYAIGPDGAIAMPETAAAADFGARGVVVFRRQLPLVAGATYQVTLAASRGADAMVSMGGNYSEVSAAEWWTSYNYTYEKDGHPHEQSTTDRIHGDKKASSYRLVVPANAGPSPWIEASVHAASSGAGKVRLHICRVE